MAGIPKPVDVPITGFSQDGNELRDIPNAIAIKELTFDVRLDDASGGTTVTGDPFNVLFDYIELLFDEEVQWRIDDLVSLQAITLFYTGKKAFVNVLDNTSTTTPRESVTLKFTAPVMWTSSAKHGKPQLNIKYANNGLTSRLVEIRAIQEANTSDFERFRFVRERQAGSSGAELLFDPDNNKAVRGAFIYAEDSSATMATAQKFSLAMFGGNIGFEEITLTHAGIDYLPARTTERDVLTLMYKQFPLIPQVISPYMVPRDTENTLIAVFNKQADAYLESPFVYIYNSSDLAANELPADGDNAIGTMASYQTFLYLHLYDIIGTASTNTTLKLKCEDDADLVGSWAAGDRVGVIWVYKADIPTDNAK